YIGRVVVAQDKRHQGLGQAVMKAALEFCHITMPRQTIIISALSYLAQFYRELGFQETGDYYLEDNIPHMRMKHIATN
ncbi:MAG: GNAT family N-acetyltransferase, partial [Proteobacteria bacterium]